MPKYIPLTSDFGFKRIFSNPEHPHILISFIESVIPSLSIQSIEYMDTKILNVYEEDRASVFDVYCTLEDGSHVLVEMQNLRQTFYVDRTILYASHIIQRQAKKGVWNYELPPVYVISVMNFRQRPTDQNLVHTVTLQSDQKPDHPFYDKLKLIYIQLPNITNQFGNPFEQTHPLTTWLNVLRNLHKNEKPMLINTDSKTKKSILAAMTLAEYESLTTAEKTVIELSQYAEAEAYSIWETAKLDGHAAGMEQGLQEGMEKGLQEGKEESREEGREEGQYQKAMETAKRLLALGVDITTIQSATDLSDTDLKRLQHSTGSTEP